ncbi:sialic acid TRAP transporter substrate-binding protein SiaP [Fodinicurvata sediminis]|uniref:sialic acid TRAP transporter substrate-binding protein SiaP n=1 Tax=Fodinicurvata sediminis TaxID=1121832 RepID=UPI0003B310DB|nr:sialic acid TRAP transporter substrate-binding protein SiaP [Fodinicurvata sediminis]
MTKLTFLGKCGLMALAVGAVATANTASAKDMKFAHVYETSEPFHEWAVWAADELEKRTDGRHTMEVFPASSLGKEVDINEGLGLGTVDVIYTGNQFAARSYGPIGIAGAPYMFRDVDHWKAYRESDLFRELAQGYRDETDNKVITQTYYGQRHVTSNTEVDTPSDMEGLKIRTPNAPLYMMMPEAVGANPTPIAFAEVYLALQQGTVDAQENPLNTIRAKKFYEVQDYINLTGHITDSLLTIVSGMTWNALSEEDQEILTNVLEEAAQGATQDIIESEQELVAWFEDEGTTVNQDVDREAFRETVRPHLTGEDVDWSQETFDRLQNL